MVEHLSNAVTQTVYKWLIHCLRYKKNLGVFLKFNYQIRMAQNKIPHQTIRNISTTSDLILKILEAA